MPARDEIVRSLQDSLSFLEETYGALATGSLRAPCTHSEMPGAGDWSPLDHLAHLVAIEGAFNEFCTRTLDGDERPIRWEGSNRDEILAYVHRTNQAYVESRRHMSLDEIMASVRSRRAATLDLVAKLSDDDLGRTVPGAPWADGTVGGILAVHTDHWKMHRNWADAGTPAAV
jgi:hypothetical protein